MSLSTEMTLEEKKTQTLMKLRGYKMLNREEDDEIVTYLVEKKNGERLLIWCILTSGTVGVRYVDKLKKAKETAEAEGGIIVTSGRYTPTAKVRAARNDIELIPRFFPSFNIFDYTLVPKHEILTIEEKEKVLEKYQVQPYQLPWIMESDPVAIAIGAKPGDILKIIRESSTAGKFISYRYVIEG